MIPDLREVKITGSSKKEIRFGAAHTWDSAQTAPQVLMYKWLRYEFVITEKGAAEKEHEQSFSYC